MRKIISWENSKKAPEGKIIKILGQPGDNNTEMIAIALEKGFNEKLSDEVEKKENNRTHWYKKKIL